MLSRFSLCPSAEWALVSSTFKPQNPQNPPRSSGEVGAVGNTLWETPVPRQLIKLTLIHRREHET